MTSPSWTLHCAGVLCGSEPPLLRLLRLRRGGAMFRLLVGGGADPRAPGPLFGETALHYAASSTRATGATRHTLQKRAVTLARA